MLKRLREWFFPVQTLATPSAVRLMLGTDSQASFSRLMVYGILAALYIAVVLLVGHQVLLPYVFETSRTDEFQQSLLVAGLISQFMVSMTALGMSMSVIPRERRNGTWDLVRATAGGTRQAIRAAWVSILFYRLSGWFGVLVYAPRLFMFGVLLVDLLAFRGEYLSYIIGGATPDLPLLLGLFLLTVTLIAPFILPLSAVGLEIAIGLVFSTFSRSRFLTSLFQIMLTVGRGIYGFLGAVFISSIMRSDPLAIFPQPNGSEWVGLSLSAALGDWGFTLLSAYGLDRVWRTLPFVAYSGVALMGLIVVQLLITEGLLRWAAHRAQRME